MGDRVTGIMIRNILFRKSLALCLSGIEIRDSKFQIPASRLASKYAYTSFEGIMNLELGAHGRRMRYAERSRIIVQHGLLAAFP